MRYRTPGRAPARDTDLDADDTADIAEDQRAANDSAYTPLALAGAARRRPTDARHAA